MPRISGRPKKFITVAQSAFLYLGKVYAAVGLSDRHGGLVRSLHHNAFDKRLTAYRRFLYPNLRPLFPLYLFILLLGWEYDLGYLVGLRLYGRQHDGDGRPLALDTFSEQQSVVVLYYFISDREPYPRAADVGISLVEFFLYMVDILLPVCRSRYRLW